jgi:para-aminobenzoate synthetase component I
MKQLIIKTIPFKTDPVLLFHALRHRKHIFFLDSHLHSKERGRYSFIGFEPRSVFSSRDKDCLVDLESRFDRYKTNARTPLTPFPSGMVGFLSYDWGLHQEKIKRRAKDDLHLPLCFFAFYDVVLTIDHVTQKLYVTATDSSAKRKVEQVIDDVHRTVKNLDESFSKVFDRLRLTMTCNFTKHKYLKTVQNILGFIERGDIYQANLSQRFTFHASGDRVDPASLYERLRTISPSDFSAYFDAGSFQLISNSPERFLSLQKRHVSTSPMKGTRSRGDNLIKDKMLKREIEKSAKDRAELLMITDLERNDLGKVCEFGSVRVKTMRAIETYNYVYQATSTIEGRLQKNKNAFDLIKACFPGGSITGCPKIRAMNIIEESEPTRRAIYTGSFGYLSFNGNLDMNILIRTLLKKRNKLYFQVGSGIVADSKADEEYAETLVKAKAMRECLDTFHVSQSDIIFLDEKMVQADAVLLERITPGIIKAKGVFETMRYDEKGIFLYEEHMKRLKAGLKALGILYSVDKKFIYHTIQKLVKENRLSMARVRVSVWQEKNKVRFAIVVQLLSSPKSEYRAWISPLRRNHSDLSHLKTLDYVVCRRSLKAARTKGYDEALLFNNKRGLVEGAHTNIFIVKKGEVFTPPLDAGCLEGVTRGCVLNLLKNMHIPVRDNVMNLRSLFTADEAFLTNSLIGVMPLVQVNRTPIGRGQVGMITARLIKSYCRLQTSLVKSDDF